MVLLSKFYNFQTTLILGKKKPLNITNMLKFCQIWFRSALANMTLSELIFKKQMHYKRQFFVNISIFDE